MSITPTAYRFGAGARVHEFREQLCSVCVTSMLLHHFPPHTLHY